MLQYQDLNPSHKTTDEARPDFKPAIVIPAFNRVDSLKRLLFSLSIASYPNETTLILSIDGGGNRDVADVAKDFSWKHGEKIVIRHEHNLGLYKHLIACGDMTEKYGSIIIIEDDLFVSPVFYKFALAALQYYSGDPKIAGIGLYSITLNPWVWQPFIPFPDQFDVFFVQAVMAWGQVWSKETWTALRSWLENQNDKRFDVPWLPKQLMRWGPNLDKDQVKYAVETDRYFVYPKPGIITNFCDAGAHFRVNMNDFQLPIILDERQISLCRIQDSRALYDAWYEPQPSLLSGAHPALSDNTFSVDLFGARDPADVSTPLMLTVQTARNPIVSFGLHMRPREVNVLMNIPGDDIFLARTEDVSRRRSLTRIGYREHYYSYSHLKVSQLATAIFAKAYSRARRMILARQFR